MPKPKKKTWQKSKDKIFEVGTCKYCTDMMTNMDSFVSFHGGGHAHWQCMKEDSDKPKSNFDW